jgi:hypothetical protein
MRMKSSIMVKMYPNMVKTVKCTLREPDSLKLETGEQKREVMKIYGDLESHIRHVKGVKASSIDNCHTNSMLATSTLPD